MLAPLYNTVAGITHFYLRDLAGLNQLAADRRAAANRKEPLNEFCVLGRFLLDTSGHCSPITENAPADLYRVNPYDKDSHVPLVLNHEELWAFMRGEMLTSSMGWGFPPEYATCPLCGARWTIENCHDIIVDQGHEYIDISDFAGLRLADIKEIPSLVGKVKHFIDRDSVGCPVGTKGEGIRNTTSGQPWRYVEKDHVVMLGDVAFVQTLIFKHDACYRRDLARRQREEMERAFAKAGYPKVNLITIPNEYHGGGNNGRKLPYYAAPWYMAQVGDGPIIKIGWRKSVISINWEATGKALPDLFAGEEVTKESYLVHAWGYDKAAEYLAKLLLALEAP
jgi:hypothetical protein